MKSLFLFFTQGEMGSPPYLSHIGEKGVENFSTSFCQFLKNTLNVDYESNINARRHSLKEDTIWQQYINESLFIDAIKESFKFFNDILFIAGSEQRTLRSCEIIAQQIALPICIDSRLDKHSKLTQKKGILENGLNSLIENLSNEINPKLILVGTSLPALTEWLQNKLPSEKAKEVEETLKISSENDKIPVAFIAGIEKNENEIKWVIDVQ